MCKIATSIRNPKASAYKTKHPQPSQNEITYKSRAQDAKSSFELIQFNLKLSHVVSTRIKDVTKAKYLIKKWIKFRRSAKSNQHGLIITIRFKAAKKEQRLQSLRKRWTVFTSERYKSEFTRGLKECQIMDLLKCYRFCVLRELAIPMKCFVKYGRRRANRL